MHKYAVALTAVTALGGVALADIAPVNAQANDQTMTELRQAVKDLQGQVDTLKAQTNSDWMTEQRAAEIKGLVQDVLADADTRSSLLQSGVSAGWDKDKGFFISSDDGNYLLRIGGQVQVRFNYNHQDDSPVDDNRMGFEMRRTKLILRGNVFDPTWTYEAQFNADRGSGNLVLEDAGWLQKNFENGWKVTFGQLKAPFTREEINGSGKLLAIERSLVNTFFTAGTVQGVRLGYEKDNWRAFVMYHDGNRSANTVWSAEDTEYAFSGRFEFLAQGAWKTLEDYSSFKDEDHGILLGAAINYSMQEFGTGPTGFNNNEIGNLGLTADATVDLGGATIYGAVIYRQLDPSAAGAPTLDQLGILARASFFVADTIELFGQYEWADADVDTIEELSIITVGVNKYWNKHGLKWSNDIGYGINAVDASFANDAAGWRTDSTDSDGQVVFRSQFQLLF